MNTSELELTVVGTLLTNNEFYQKAKLTPEMFLDPVYREIWSVCARLIKSGEPVDPFTILDELKSDSLRDILMEALSTGWSQTMGQSFAERMIKNHRSRTVKAIALELANDPSLANQAIQQLMSIGQDDINFDLTIKTVIKNALDHIQMMADNDGLVGITTGIDRLDAVLGGFHPSDFIVIAARPAMGKTALMLNMLIKSECSAGVFSAEMGSTQIGSRLLSISSGVEAQKLRRGTVDTEDFSLMADSFSRLVDRDIRINDKPAPTLDEIINQSRKWKLENKVEIIYLDYLQRIKLKGNAPRHEQVGEAARTLKELARELDIPIVVLAQVSRQAEGRHPTMADLAQSGEIEAEADQIMFLYRDEVYNPSEEVKGVAELLISKNRHGDTGIVICKWIAASMQCTNSDT